MNILVTGGAGYVGSHTVKQLAAAGHHVVVVDNLSMGHSAAVVGAELVEADLFEARKIADLFDEHKVEAVMHFAALAYVGESVSDPAKYYRNNIVGTLALLDAMRAAGVNRIVFSSTCATYGVPSEMPIRETHPQAPINPYGFTKLAIERALEDYRHAYGLGYAALRYFNAAGASLDGMLGEDHDPETHLIPLVLQVALGQRESVQIFGNDYPTPDGTCVRDYIHVDDLTRAHIAALERLQSGNAMRVNLGTGVGVSVRQVIETCRQLTGRDIAAIEAPRREGDPPELIASCELASELLDWKARDSDIETVVRTAWDWMQRNPNGYENV